MCTDLGSGNPALVLGDPRAILPSCRFDSGIPGESRSDSRSFAPGREDNDHFCDLDCAQRRIAASVRAVQTSGQHSAPRPSQACTKRSQRVDRLRSPSQSDPPRSPRIAAHLPRLVCALARAVQATTWESSLRERPWCRWFLALASRSAALFSPSNLG